MVMGDCASFPGGLWVVWVIVGGCGWLWVIVHHFLGEFCGWLWMVMGDCAWLWVVVGDHGRLWVIVGDCGWLWVVMGDCVSFPG